MISISSFAQGADQPSGSKLRRAGSAERSLNERVLIVGVGGLGVPAALRLARSGAAQIVLVDPDPVELSNLARQVIYRIVDLGRPKVEAAASRLARRFRRLRVEAKPIALEATNAAELVKNCAFVIDATDNPLAKFLINDACVAAHRPFVYGGVLGLRGQVMTVIPGQTACLRCLFEGPPDADEAASCREAGIVGPVAGAIGDLEAEEVLAWLHDRQPKLAGRILAYDAAAGKIHLTAVAPRRGCGCGAWREPATAGAQASSLSGVVSRRQS